MKFTRIKYDGGTVALKYVDDLGDGHSLESPCERQSFEEALLQLTERVSQALPVWSIAINTKKGTIRETTTREGSLTVDQLTTLLQEANEHVRSRRRQLDLFEATERMNQAGARITKIETVSQP